LLILRYAKIWKVTKLSSSKNDDRKNIVKLSAGIEAAAGAVLTLIN